MGRSTTRNTRKMTAGMALAVWVGLNPAWAIDAVGTESPLVKPLNLSFCIFDPLGVQGDLYAYAKDLALAARKWNVSVSLRAYSDERLATEDFRTGQCDGVTLSTLRARQFNKFIGSLDSVGAAPDLRHVKMLAGLLDNPKIAPLTVQGDYQVITVIPLGAVHVMVNDRGIDSVEHALGKRIAVLDFDRSQSKLVSRLGAQPVGSDFRNFANRFNSGQVDIITAPSLAFQPLELHRGMNNGGVYRFPLTQMTGTVLINRARLSGIPDLDARISGLRRFAVAEMEKSEAYIARQEQSIPARYWIDLPAAEEARFTALLRDSRIQLTREGYYDPRMMALLKKIRCRYEPVRGECSLGDE